MTKYNFLFEQLEKQSTSTFTITTMSVFRGN